ncbi:MAG: sigma-54-dependent Fis family transcriptional regulator [Candidatus Latescibacteria bacterium]|nr:sigma-54-dependent Fis family transcriptional regulator [Candidatus Latescibacterota bacterium]
MSKILIIDDNTNFCALIKRAIKHYGFDAIIKNTLTEGVRESQKNQYDIVLLDVNLPDGNGLEVIPAIRSIALPPEIIIITAEGSCDGAEFAIKYGAWDYIQKGDSLHEITFSIIRALEYREKKLSQKIPIALKTDGIIGNSPHMKDLKDLIAQAAVSDANVLITGETGTGKELTARAIHENSSRADNNFVVVDCAALPENLVESMLLGHEKGAFTGAVMSKKGLVEHAHEGTLFLDEIGEMPYYLQKIFLRVLQERRFRPVGSTREVTSNFRLIAATNRDLDAMVREETFREDLLYRLRTISIIQPPLRDRKGDIRDLAFHYAFKYCTENGLETKGFSPEFLEMVMFYDWPGNIRELINVMEQSVIVSRDEPILFPIHLPKYIRVKFARSTNFTEFDPHKKQNESHPGLDSLPSLKEYRENIVSIAEKEYLKELMKKTEGDIEKACIISNLKRARLYSLLKKYSISKII